MMTFFFFIIVPILVVYFYGFICMGKFLHYRGELDLEPEKDIGTRSVLWPLCAVLEPDTAKALIFPSLWLWPRFREEYPVIKAEKQRERKFAHEMRRKDTRRHKVEAHGKISMEDAKEDLRHQKRMHLLDEKTEEYRQQFINDYPPELTAGETYEPEPEVEVANDVEQFCVKHQHWVTNGQARFDCRF